MCNAKSIFEIVTILNLDSTNGNRYLLAHALNCLYFAVGAMEKVTLNGFISIMNRPTLISLSHNRAIQVCYQSACLLGSF